MIADNGSISGGRMHSDDTSSNNVPAENHDSTCTIYAVPDACLGAYCMECEEKQEHREPVDRDWQPLSEVPFLAGLMRDRRFTAKARSPPDARPGLVPAQSANGFWVSEE